MRMLLGLRDLLLGGRSEYQEDVPQERVLEPGLRAVYERYSALDVSRDSGFGNLVSLLNSDTELRDLIQRKAVSGRIVDGRDSSEGYGGTVLFYNTEKGLMIHDWAGMCEISDYDTWVAATDESMRKYFGARFTPAHLKGSVLECIQRGGRLAEWIHLEEFLAKLEKKYLIGTVEESNIL